MARWQPPLPLLLLSLFLLSTATTTTALNADMQTLLAFKATSDVSSKLSTWNFTDGNPCSGAWYGVSCSRNHRVSRLVLEGLSLSGTGFSSLATLDQLRVLSLKDNSLSGEIPDLSNLTALKLLFLSHNNFSGPIPTSLGSLTRLYRLDLSSNSLSGPIPAVSLNYLTHLLTLRLDENNISGPISPIRLPNLQDFNVSSNLLSGAIPPSLAIFPASSFQSNPSLCGPPVSSGCANIVSDPTRPGSETSTSSPTPNLSPSSPLTPTSPAETAVVSSSPSTKPESAASSSSTVTPPENPTRKEGRMSKVAVIAIVVGDFAVLLLVSGLLFCYFWKKYSGHSRSRLQEGEKIVYSSSPYTSAGGGAAAGGNGFERGKLVFFEGTKRFELEDLLRASAEMLGKGGYGTAYKAVLDDGHVVAVKRLRDITASSAATSGGGGGGGGVGRREFEQQTDVLGRLRHPNLVGLKAFYYARDEKLLVYEYMPNGSLFSLLHGNRGPGRTPLDWTTRLRIAAGSARGLAFLHSHRSSPKLFHGNIKSTNVLIDKAGNARISDFGLTPLAPTSLPPSTNGYRAPEAASSSTKPSHKADVYAFGVLLLELLTGKYPSQLPEGNVGGGGTGGVMDLPRWVQSVVREEWTAEVFDLELMRYKNIEEEMVGMLQIAMSCTATVPDQRPSMSHVLKMIEEIRGGEVSPSHESFDSVSDSPSVSDGTAS